MESEPVNAVTIATGNALHWTLRDGEAGIAHQELLGTGGYGEVHQV